MLLAKIQKKITAEKREKIEQLPKKIGTFFSVDVAEYKRLSTEKTDEAKLKEINKLLDNFRINPESVGYFELDGIKYYFLSHHSKKVAERKIEEFILS